MVTIIWYRQPYTHRIFDSGIPVSIGTAAVLCSFSMFLCAVVWVRVPLRNCIWALCRFSIRKCQCVWRTIICTVVSVMGRCLGFPGLCRIRPGICYRECRGRSSLVVLLAVSLLSLSVCLTNYDYDYREWSQSVNTVDNSHLLQPLTPHSSPFQPHIPHIQPSHSRMPNPDTHSY